MTTIELFTFVLLMVATSAGTWWILSRHRNLELAAGRDPQSSAFASAAASRLLSLKLDPLVGPGSVLYLPVGDGLYFRRTSTARSRAWRRTLTNWLDRGATIHVIASRPNKAAKDIWHKIGSGHSSFFYHELDRGSAEPNVAREIARLDTYHPIVLVNRAGRAAPGAMWIEQNHPLDSGTAYGVQYVAPADIRTDSRFEIFLNVYDLVLGYSQQSAAADQRKVA